MKRGQKQKNRNRRNDKNLVGDDVPVMQINTRWGNNKSLYFEDGDSGSETDEERLVEEALDREDKHLEGLNQNDFKIFGNVQKLKPIEVPDSLDDLEEKLDKEKTKKLSKVIRSVIMDITDASRELQNEFEDTEADKARKQLLYSLLTNGCFYLHLVASGYKSEHHPSLKHIEKIKKLLGVDDVEVENNENEEVAVVEEEEEEEANEETEKEEETETKHIPNQLKTIKEGEYRPVTSNILKNQIIIPNKVASKKAPRTHRKKQYSHALHKYNLTHKKKKIANDGIYRGELSGIDTKKRGSIKLHPAH